MKNRIGQLQNWAQQRPAWVAMGVILLAYLYYLPTTDYLTLHYDANSYWDLSKQHFASGHFSFLSSYDPLRGYLFPLLLSPLVKLVDSQQWQTLSVTRVVGAGLAAVLFGWSVPALWQTITGGPPVGVIRRLVFAALGFALWRNYFNFCLTDFPAMLALCVSLTCLLGKQRIWLGLCAGMAIAAALNLRPVFQAALPAVALLALLPPPGQGWKWAAARFGAFGLGMALLLAPQLYFNSYHMGVNVPWVLTSPPGTPSLYIQQLEWGLTMQKYETNVGDDYRYSNMVFIDQEGRDLLHQNVYLHLTGVTQYVHLLQQYPLPLVGVWFRHVFNAMDVQYPTPYIRYVFTPTWKLAWLNYSIWWACLLLVVRIRRPLSGWPRLMIVVAALLLPCAAVVPTAIECRYLLPLHLLLSAAVAFSARPVAWWRSVTNRQRAAALALYAVVITSAFYASSQAQLSLTEAPRDIVQDIQNSLLPAREEAW
ncbi:hypothetical protein MUN81_09755 [Hymenobacter sp. 5317J-9]|uniref:hypothetical protein n=1 Tax=Hymenobacter sp. 5317J-9 TaxID=2932250 RepID=UPI001FD713C3|nr:hypothetical protein [Hymenobacter sp. 5317J-9]UOQ99764.1 hypothetical protein MUN81_09755 [Hymenobacter sp. 5317J-9]